MLLCEYIISTHRKYPPRVTSGNDQADKSADLYTSMKRGVRLMTAHQLQNVLILWHHAELQRGVADGFEGWEDERERDTKRDCYNTWTIYRKQKAFNSYSLMGCECQ